MKVKTVRGVKSASENIITAKIPSNEVKKGKPMTPSFKNGSQYDVENELDLEVEIEKQMEQLSEEEEIDGVQKCRNSYDIFKFIGIFLFNCSLLVVMGQSRRRKFGNEQTWQLFLSFLCLRPAIIFFYSTTITFLTGRVGKDKVDQITDTGSKTFDEGSERSSDEFNGNAN